MKLKSNDSEDLAILYNDKQMVGVIDFGGRRRVMDRRSFTYIRHIPERRSGHNRRSGFDRRSITRKPDQEITEQRRGRKH